MIVGRRAILACGLVLARAAAAQAPLELADPPEVHVTATPVATPARPLDPRLLAPPRAKRRRHRREAGIPPQRPTRPEPVREAEPEPAPAPVEPAPVEEAEPAPEVVAAAPARRVQFTFHGFVMARATIARTDPDAAFAGIIPALDAPRAFVEVDLQPSLHVLGRRLHLFADLTFYVASNEPKYLFLMNEAYLESQVAGPVYLVAGRKRVVWGSGLAANPTDLINPVKNPLDFEQQRAGAFLLPMIEVVTKWVTFSALLTPHTTFDGHGLPNGMDFTQPLVASRLYFLVGGVDLNLMYLYDHRRGRHFGGVSLARYFGDKLEAHLEALVGQGPSELPPVPIVPACGTPSPALDKVSASLIGGGRVDLSDRTFISLEYLFNGDGFSKDAYDQYRIASPCTRAALAVAPPPPASQAGHPIDPIFVLMRQHYLAVSFVRPHVTSGKLEDLSIAASAIWSVEDLSLLLQARVAYKLFEQATLGLQGAAWVGPREGQFWSSPTRLTAQLDLKVAF